MIIRLIKAITVVVCGVCLWKYSPNLLVAVLTVIGGGVATTIFVAIRTFFRVYKHGVSPATLCNNMSYDGCVLARFLPEIRGSIGWKKLGNYPTPVHKLHLSQDDNEIKIQVKREDLSNETYGGNKIRSLEFLLPGPEQKNKEISTFGAPGSNQILATSIHTSENVTGIYVEKEANDRDNALNILSFISFPSNTILPLFAKNKLSTLWNINKKVDSSSVLFPGGANPVGVLGNVGGFLEFVEQVKKGDAEPVDVIILPLGSGCTTAGMVLGAALAEHLTIGNPVVIHAVVIHHGFATAQKFLGVVRKFVQQLVKDASQILINCGAIPLAVQQRAIQIVNDSNLLKITPYSGSRYGSPKYGAHSSHSRAAKENILSNSTLHSDSDEPPQPLWLCSTFTSKSAAVMLDELALNPKTRFLFWQTKSAVQPINKHGDEWKELEKQHPWVQKYVTRNVTDKKEYGNVTSRL